MGDRTTPHHRRIQLSNEAGKQVKATGSSKSNAQTEREEGQSEHISHRALRKREAGGFPWGISAQTWHLLDNSVAHSLSKWDKTHLKPHGLQMGCVSFEATWTSNGMRPILSGMDFKRDAETETGNR